MSEHVKSRQCGLSVQTAREIYIVLIDVLPVYWQANTSTLVDADFPSAKRATTIKENGDCRIQVQISK